jgi:hypothetical protein
MPTFLFIYLRETLSPNRTISGRKQAKTKTELLSHKGDSKNVDIMIDGG